MQGLGSDNTGSERTDGGTKNKQFEVGPNWVMKEQKKINEK